MDRELNSRFGKETIYEIYKGCRLCGACAGYKMPIVQNVVDLEENGVKLSHKIRKCIQIEVHQDDRMPPLICELCVDKVNDFYDFLVMCQQTNTRTRLKLGLPLLTGSNHSKYESSNCCIIGTTETISIDDDDSDVEPIKKPTTKSKFKDKRKEENHKSDTKTRIIRDIDNSNKIEPARAGRVTRNSNINKVEEEKLPLLLLQRINGPTRVTRLSCGNIKRERTTSPTEVDSVRVTRTMSNLCKQEMSLASLQDSLNKIKVGSQIKSILKKEKCSERIKIVDETALFTRPKRSVGIVDKPSVPAKKVRISSDTPRLSSKVTSIKSKLPEHAQKTFSKKPSSNSKSKLKRPAAETVRLAPSPVASDIMCPICYFSTRNLIGYNNHLRIHVPHHTNNKLACNPCGEWFINTGEAQKHNNRHTLDGIPYSCRRCSADFKGMPLYNEHLKNGECIPYDIVPDVKCESCFRYFATDNLLIQHKCYGEDERTGGKVKTEPGVMESLKPLVIRLVRCDSMVNEKGRILLKRYSGTRRYGLDDSCVYPYISSVRSLKIKSEPLDDSFDCMVDINVKVKEFLAEDDCIDWTSDIVNDNDEDTSDNTVNKRQRVDALAALALKAVVSQRFLGKVPKKYRKIRVDKMVNNVGGFGVKNIDKLLERLDDVDNTGAIGEHESSDIQNENSNAKGDEDSNKLSASDRENTKSGQEMPENDNHTNESIEHCNSEGSENGEESENGRRVNSTEVTSEIIDGSCNEVKCLGINKLSENSDICNDKRSNGVNQDSDREINPIIGDNTTVEANGHVTEGVKETSTEISGHIVGVFAEGFAMKDKIDFDYKGIDFISSFDERNGDDKEVYNEAEKIDNSDKRSKGDLNNRSDKICGNIGLAKLDHTANKVSDNEKKLMIENDRLANKGIMDQNSSYLDAISDDGFNF